MELANDIIIASIGSRERKGNRKKNTGRVLQEYVLIHLLCIAA